MHMTLAFPINVLVYKFHVVSPVHFGKNQVHFHICEAVKKLAPILAHGKQQTTYFRPKQPRGPSEKGWLASLMSAQSGSIHRSGLKAKGSWKFSASCVTVHGLVYTSTYRDFSAATSNGMSVLLHSVPNVHQSMSQETISGSLEIQEDKSLVLLQSLPADMEAAVRQPQ